MNLVAFNIFHLKWLNADDVLFYILELRNSVQEELLPLLIYFSKTVSSSVYLTKSMWDHLGDWDFIPGTPAPSFSSTLLWAPCHWPRGGRICIFRKILLRISTRQNPSAPLLKNAGTQLQPQMPRKNPSSWLACSTRENFQIWYLMSPLCALPCGSGHND